MPIMKINNKVGVFWSWSWSFYEHMQNFVGSVGLPETYYSTIAY